MYSYYDYFFFISYLKLGKVGIIILMTYPVNWNLVMSHATCVFQIIPRPSKYYIRLLFGTHIPLYIDTYSCYLQAGFSDRYDHNDTTVNWYSGQTSWAFSNLPWPTSRLNIHITYNDYLTAVITMEMKSARGDNT